MVLTLVATMLFFLILGFPMFMSMLVAPLIVMLLYIPQLDPALLTQQLIAGVQPFVLLAVPMFIFAADLMCVGQTANRLLDFVEAFVGHIRGGLAITTSAACAFFGSISGSCQATVVAIGKPMRQRMLQAGYHDSNVMALIINAAELALLIPPSIAMLMYAVVTGSSVSELFIAGIGPGLLILLFLAVYNWFMAKRENIPVIPKASWRERFRVTKRALYTFGFPLIILGGIYTGFFSPTEAAAVSVLYALILELFIYKSITVKDIPRIALSTGLVTSAVFILVAGGNAFSWVITFARIPQLLTDNLLGSNPSALTVLFAVTISYFIACMFVDSIVAILVLTPIFFPLAMQAGIDPIHLGIIITLQAAIGASTPPFGCDIFTAVAVFERPYFEVIRKAPPYIAIFVLGNILLIFFPQIALFLRDVVMR
ncbi:TRAP transporter large permease [Zhaonella formicivorans]|uniref:TRAP transporter large permease n=1 Tax=Zhaonella formicivorans TaxID=2528593 RepID=UPI0010E5CC72|nr:TRAP transporter large permease [Zhaonella formicivorans]